MLFSSYQFIFGFLPLALIAFYSVARFGRIPHVGEHFDWDGWRIEVVDLDGPRVDKLLVQRVADGSGHDGA